MLSKIEIEKQHNIPITEYTGKGVMIAVMDSSFNTKHPAIKHALSEPHLWYDGFNNCYGHDEVLLNRRSLFYDNQADHGNHTLGLAAGVHHQTGEKLGLATGAILVPVCGMNSNGLSFDKERKAAYLRSLNYLKQLPCKIINFSQELEMTEEVLLILIELVEQGKLILYAAGNNGRCLNEPNMESTIFLQNPILRKGLLTVGSLAEYDGRAVGYKYCVSSSYVQFPFKGNIIWVRGKERFSASGSDYNVQSGTSMATPTAAGAIALLWEQNPSLTNEEIIKIVVASGTPIAMYGNKLNVGNMLNPETQKNILGTTTSLPDESVLKTFSPKAFPEIQIAVNRFDHVTFANPSAEVIFRKLSTAEIRQYLDPDIQQLLKANQTLVSQAESIALYGIMYRDEVRSCLVMACLVMMIDNELVLIADEFVWRVNDQRHILNELALQLSTHPALSNFKAVYANWGVSLFQDAKFRDQKVKNIRELNNTAAMILQLVPKKEDLLPAISISSNDVEGCKDSLWQLSKVDPEADHQSLVHSLKKGWAFDDYIKENAHFCTLPHCQRYDFKFKESGKAIKAYLNKDKQIILYCNNSIDKHEWFSFSQALLTFNLEAKKLGYTNVLYACSDFSFKLPFRQSKQDLTITDEMKLTIYPNNLQYLELYDLNTWDFTSKVGEHNYHSSALSSLTEVNDRKAVEYYLKNGADVNALDRYQQNALHLAVYYKNIDLVRLLCEAGIDQTQMNSNRKTPFDVAQESGCTEITDYLSSQNSLQPST